MASSKLIGWRVRQASRKLAVQQAAADKTKTRLEALRKLLKATQAEEAKIPPKPKRGPGRPRKDGSAPVPKASGKKRGRPPKNAASKPVVAGKPVAAAKGKKPGKRGRPPKKKA